MNRCWTCQRPLTDYRHYKTCVSKKNWPAEFLKPKTVVEETAQPSRQMSDSSANICPDCGFEAKSAFGLNAHQRKHMAVLSD